MAITATYEHASGLSIDDCAFLGLRYEEESGFRPESSECWIMAARAQQVPKPYRVIWQGGTLSWYSGLFQAPSGRVYVSDMSGQLHSNPDLWAPHVRDRWEEHQLGTPLSGVWGLDDLCVFTWGGTPVQGWRVFRFDGATWSELPSPGFDVRAMHGVAPDLVYAVGIGGRIGRWDGARWTEPWSPVGEDLKSVFVASPDEIYACGAAGSLIEGSSHGFGVIDHVGTTLHAVAKWNGELFVGGGPRGLYRRAGRSGRVELYKEKVKATSIDARGELVIGTYDHVVGSRDGQELLGIAKDALRDGRAVHVLGDLG